MCFWSGPASDLYGPLWKITWILQGDDCNGTEIRLHIINVFIEKMDASRSMQGSIHFGSVFRKSWFVCRPAFSVSVHLLAEELHLFAHELHQLVELIRGQPN